MQIRMITGAVIRIFEAVASIELSANLLSVLRIIPPLIPVTKITARRSLCFIINIIKPAVQPIRKKKGGANRGQAPDRAAPRQVYAHGGCCCVLV